jgi:hypothetical protein
MRLMDFLEGRKPKPQSSQGKSAKIAKKDKKSR